MIRRRAFVFWVGAAVASPSLAFAQERVRVIGYLAGGVSAPILGHFKEGLRKLGYVEGKNIRIELRSAEGKLERLAELAQELVRLKVDVLATYQTPAATAAKKATTQIPIVMAAVGDPVATGLIASLARPGGNITGTAGSTSQMGSKLLEIVRDVLPQAKRVGVLVNVNDPFAKPFLEQLERAGPLISMEIAAAMIKDHAELDGAIASLAKKGTDVMVVQPSLRRRVAAELALKHRLPAVAPNGLFPEEGGLLGYSGNQAQLQYGAADYVDRILKGAKPADLPVQQPIKFDLAINLKTAKALGIRVPNSVLVRADQVIE